MIRQRASGIAYFSQSYLRAAFSAAPEPPRVVVPLERIKFKYIRSSGPGGQNVNKVATCVEGRLDVRKASWLDDVVRERLMELQKHRITKRGELIVRVQDERTQLRNKTICVQRIQELVDEASVIPKERKHKKVSAETKKRWVEQKRRRSEIKKSRSNSNIQF